MSNRFIKPPLNILMAQMNPTVGAIAANTTKIIDLISMYQSQYDLIVFPELSITGYPIEDLVFRDAVLDEVEVARQAIINCTKECHVVIGYPSRNHNLRFNTAAVLYQQNCIAEYHKFHLPNYGVFDEARYFATSNHSPCLFTIQGYQLGLVICEDLWQPGPVESLIEQGIELLITINASPFELQKAAQRQQQLRTYAKKHMAIIYVNQVGGQDELVFDGRSCVMDADGNFPFEASAFSEDLYAIHYQEGKFTAASGSIKTPAPEKNSPFHLSTPHDDSCALIYQALMCGLRDYVNKNHFPGVLLGLSGGIDSALTLAIAVDALGASRVKAVFMPSRYTADISEEDALMQIRTLNVAYDVLPIEASYQAIIETLAPVFVNQPLDTTEENLQARIRGLLLMALSNKSGYMLLNTSNKSEMAVGYSTLYGDMCGGFSVLKDVYKTMVYSLSHYRNHLSAVIPERVLTRPPTAELAFNQTDQDSLPDYALLDAILKDHIENRLDAAALIQAGYPQETVLKVVRLIARNEYKRYQSPPGTKITACAFGRDWRYPITKRLQN